MAKPVGSVTRGTTGVNRLRRADRWLTAVHGRLLRAAERPLVVDLGYGASHTTTLELFTRVRAVAPDAEVVGIEIDPARVALARPYEREGLSFVLGGFELPVSRPPTVVRAFNVLRQYGEAEAWGYWDLLRGRLAPRRCPGGGDLLGDRAQGGVGLPRRVGAEDADVLGEVQRLRAAVGPGRPAAEDAHPPQRAWRADPRLPPRLRQGVGLRRPLWSARPEAALAGGRRDPRGGLAGVPRGAAGRNAALAAGRADPAVGGRGADLVICPLCCVLS
ncbi:hypothetical protein [Nonomuraea dietziae]|uniref:hypothetical protein n=1 Tax=Nonomuraea dietziae TaxID=65515 RepID=UPI0031D15B78